MMAEQWEPIEKNAKDGKSFIGLYWGQDERRGDVCRMWWQPEFEAYISACRQMTMAPGYTIDGKTSKLHSPTIEEPTHFMPFDPPED